MPQPKESARSVFVVEVHARLDGLYVFESADLRRDFVSALPGAADFDEYEETVCGLAETRALIKAEEAADEPPRPKDRPVAGAGEGQESPRTERTPPVSAGKRKFKLEKVEAGDYLFLSNDATTLWRVRRYDDEFVAEDGVSIEARSCWGVWKWLGRIEPGAALDPFDWGQWDFWEGLHDTRAKAIDAALKAGPDVPAPKGKSTKEAQ